MKRFIFISILSAGLLCLALFPPNTVHATGLTEDMQIVEIGSQDGITMSETDAFFKELDFRPYEIRGEIQVSGQPITFGMFNIEETTSTNFFKRIDSEIEQIIKQADPSGTDVQNAVAIAKRSLKLKLITLHAPTSKFSKQEKKLDQKINELRSNHQNIKATSVLKSDRDQLVEKMKKEKEKQYADHPVSESINTLNQQTPLAANLTTAKKNKQTQSPYLVVAPEAEPLGGPSMYTETCGGWDTNPYCGDGQDRLKQKNRFNLNGAVYDWLPYWVSGKVEEIDPATYMRRVRLDWKWDSAGLANLVIDSNEAVEAEVLFYNYGSQGLPNMNGYAYMYQLPTSWYTNLPDGYLDTRFGDNEKEKGYAVGTDNPQALQAGVQYYFSMTAQPSTTFVPNGLWSINFSRGYWYDSTNLAYRAVRGSGTEWYVFNEEKESFALIKHYHKNNSKYYAPGSFSEFTKKGYYEQFRYKQGFDVISGGQQVNLGTVGSGQYRVHKLQVNATGTYDIRTWPTSTTTQSDTYMRLYNHDFTQIAYNDDDGEGLYSRIVQSLAPGDYYIIVHGYNYGSMSSYLRVNY